MDVIKIFLVDDHQLVRDGIKALLSGVEDVVIAGEATFGAELLEKLKEGLPDVILMDISLPGLSGIELTRMIREKHSSIRILILSMYTHEDFVFNAMKAGAKGYLPKNTSREELLDAIHAVYTGQEFLGESISKAIMKSFIRQATQPENPTDPLIHSLTSREKDILKLFAEGFTNSEIGDKLNISIRTVESHKNHIVRKLGLKSTVDLIRFAIRNRMVEA